MGRSDNESQSRSRARDVAPILLIVLACSLAIYPLLQPGLPPTGDGPLHLMRSFELDLALRSGAFYPRWAPDLALGYGFPIFNYYAPLLYYLVEIPHLLGLSLDNALRLVIFASFLVDGIAIYWWTRPFLGPAGATVAGLAYTYAPVRIFEAYDQGDYPQLLALALAPIAFGSAWRVLSAERFSYRRFLALTLSLSALVVAHNISTLLLAPALAGYALVITLASPSSRRATINLVTAGGAALLALGLTAFFWLPALVEQDIVQLYRLATKDFDVRNHFTSLAALLTPPQVIDQTASNPPSLLYLGWGQLALAIAAAALLIFIILRRKYAALTRPVVSHLIAGAGLLIVSAAMTLPFSAPIWTRIPLLVYTEFPTRTLGLAAIGTALLAGLATYLALQVVESAARPGLVCAVARATVVAAGAAIVVIPSLVYLYPREPFLEYSRLDRATVIDLEQSSGAIGTTSAGEYFPRDVTTRPTTRLPDTSATGRLDRTTLPDGSSVTFLGASGYAERYRLSLPTATSLRFNLIRFPGWIVSVDSASVPTHPSTGTGLLVADVTAGDHLVTIDFVDTPIRHAGWVSVALSALVLVGVGLVILLRKIRYARKVAGPATDVGASGSDHRFWATGRAVGLSLTTASAAGCLLALLLGLRIAQPAPYRAVFARQSPVDRPLGMSHPVGISLDDKIELLGYDLADDTVKPGGQVQITLYWRALAPLTVNYHSLAMVARVGDGGLIAQDDRVHPGGIPTRSWPTDRYIVDQKTIDVPANASPLVYQLEVALYDPKTLAHLQRVGMAGSGGDHVTLQQIHVVPATPVDLSTYRSAGDPVFDGKIALRGYKVNADHLHAGQTLDVTFLWQASQPIPSDYTVFTHLLDAKQDQAAGKDSVPLNGEYPTSAWLPGEPIEDRYEIGLPTDLRAGAYHVAVGLYDATTMRRLTATAPGWGAPRDQVELDISITVD